MSPSESESSLLERLLALPSGERAVALAAACAQDPALAARRDALQAALTASVAERAETASAPTPEAAGADHFSTAAMERVLALAVEACPAEAPGERIGPYKLLQAIGEGGFGVVWMAEQEAPIRRRVALKIIKSGMDTREVIARFEAERQALALMDHPNIAKVFEAGATPQGRPFFAMELVRGVAITRYCDENRLSTTARLRLFVPVCHAVQHAHQKGVIHRDLKPSNILVTLHDGVPVPKIIDFGIAKATSTPLTARTLFTRFNAFLGTPAYTSPEQMEMSGLDVDTRSDIYSLGVLLYELLAGRPPFDADALMKSGLEAIRRAVRETEPPRPSHRLGTLTDVDRTAVARQRSTDPARLAVQLRGDLDWIVMRCLEKDRARRYETASNLAADLERNLASEPVTARPPSNAYRLRKFVRRHRLGVLSGATIALSLVAALVIASVAFVRSRAAHARAQTAERAESQLRQEAEVARDREEKRAGRTALELADRLLADGRIAEALAYLVHAARKDPANASIAPRLASVLAAHNFLIPESAPFRCGSRVLALRYNRDGRQLFVGTEDGTFRILDVASGAVLRTVPLGQAVRRGGWVFAHDNDAVLAVCFVDRRIAVFDVASGRARWEPASVSFDLLADAGAGGGAGVGLSPDGRWVYANGMHDLVVWDAQTGKRCIERTFSPWHFGPEFATDGSFFVLSVGDQVQRWSLPDGAPVGGPIDFTARGARGVYLPPFLSPDGRVLVVCDPYAGIYVHALPDGAKLRFLPYRAVIDVSSAGFLPDGRFFVASATNVDLLDLQTGEAKSLPVVFPPLEQSTRLGTADGRLLLTATNDGVARLWDVATGQLVAEPGPPQRERFRLALAPDASQVVIGTVDGEVHRLRVGRGAARPLELPQQPPILWVPFLPGSPARGLHFARDQARAIDVASGREVAGGFRFPHGAGLTLDALKAPWPNFPPAMRHLLLRDIGGGTGTHAWHVLDGGESRFVPLENAPGHTPGVSGVAFNLAGDRVAHARSLQEVAVWDLKSGAAVGPGCRYHDEPLSLYPGIDLSPDGTRLAGSPFRGSPSRGLPLVVWDVASGRIVTEIATHADIPTEIVRFSPDGQLVLAVNGRHETRLWDANTGEPRSEVLPSTDAIDAVFSPDGRWFATRGAHGARVWDGRTGAPVSRLAGRADADLKFSHDSRRILTYDSAGIARLWDARTGQPLSEPLRHPPPVTILAGFSPDDRFVMAGVEAGRSYVWSVPPALPAGEGTPEWLLQLAAACAARTINDAEQCVAAPELVAAIDEARRTLATLPDDAPLAAWGRWLLDPSPQRAIAPGFTLAPAEADAVRARLSAQPRVER